MIFICIFYFITGPLLCAIPHSIQWISGSCDFGEYQSLEYAKFFQSLFWPVYFVFVVAFCIKKEWATYNHLCEGFWYDWLEAFSNKPNKGIPYWGRTFFIYLQCEVWTISWLSKPYFALMQLLTIITTIDDLNYPEKTNTYYIVNVPYVFSAIYKVILHISVFCDLICFAILLEFLLDASVQVVHSWHHKFIKRWNSYIFCKTMLAFVAWR